MRCSAAGGQEGWYTERNHRPSQGRALPAAQGGLGKDRRCSFCRVSPNLCEWSQYVHGRKGGQATMASRTGKGLALEGAPQGHGPPPFLLQRGNTRPQADAQSHSGPGQACAASKSNLDHCLAQPRTSPSAPRLWQVRVPLWGWSHRWCPQGPCSTAGGIPTACLHGLSQARTQCPGRRLVFLPRTCLTAHMACHTGPCLAPQAPQGFPHCFRNMAAHPGQSPGHGEPWRGMVPISHGLHGNLSKRLQ